MLSVLGYDTGTHSLQMTLPRTARVWLNCLRSPHWCWTFPLLLVQMGYGLLCNL